MDMMTRAGARLREDLRGVPARDRACLRYSASFVSDCKRVTPNKQNNVNL